MIVTIYDTLRARGNLWGTYTRPSGSDGYPPPAGTKVLWVCSQPIQDLLDQGKRLGWANKGTIGNASHLQKHGDHTGHSAGKLGGILYAKDTWCSQASLNALLQLCRDPSYDTSWIDFFNALGGQYNYAGVRRTNSSDQHLHISVKRGQETRRVTLFTDMAAVMAGTFRTPEFTMPTAAKPTSAPTGDADMDGNTKFNVPKADGSSGLESRTFAQVLGWICGKLIEHDKKLAALDQKLGTK